jgi:hypothetical protein
MISPSKKLEGKYEMPDSQKLTCAGILEGTAYRSYPIPCRGITKLFLNNRGFSSTKGKPQVLHQEACKRIGKT